MAKQTKNTITRTDIEKELRWLNRADIRACTTLGIVLLVLYGMIFAISLGIFFDSAYPVEILIGLGIFMGLLLVLCLGHPVLKVCRALKEKSMLKRGDFQITVVPLAYKDDVVVHRHTEERFHFGGFPPVHVGHTIFQMSTIDDEFYLVTYTVKKPSVKLLYACRIYEYKE